MVQYRFSRRPNRAHEINWQAWSPSPFSQAEQEDKPLFLSLSSTWCKWCAVMDETALSDTRVIDTVNDAFVAVRVDTDERPDIYTRYGAGGWPSIAILTPEGELMTGATYLGPDELLEMLANVTDIWTQNREDVRREVAELQAHMATASGPPATREPGDYIIEGSLAPALPSFDSEFGGFGRGMKFARTDILEALLHVHAAMPADSGPAREQAETILTTTLDAIVAGGLRDPIDGGFFRYTAGREWVYPHFEKLLADNAHLIRVLAEAAAVLDRPAYLEAAGEAQCYLDTALWLPDKGAYAASQDPDAAYYETDPPDARRSLDPPPVDTRTFASANALALRALAALARATGRVPHPRDGAAHLDQATLFGRAELLAGSLEGWLSPRGLLRHGGGDDPLDIMLVDQVDTLTALLDLYESTAAADLGVRRERDGHLQRAEALWRAIDAAFTVEQGAGLPDLAATADGESDPSDVRIARMARPQVAVAENSRAAAALARLSRHLDNDEYLTRAKAILSEVIPLAAEQGNYAAELGTAGVIVFEGVEGTALAAG